MNYEASPVLMVRGKLKFLVDAFGIKRLKTFKEKNMKHWLTLFYIVPVSELL